MSFPNTAPELEATILKFLEDALSMQLGLSEDDADYDIGFIAKKLALCSTYQERLSDIMLKLAQIGIEVIRVAADKKAAIKRQSDKLKASEEYGQTPRAARAEWLGNQLEEARADAERWDQIRSAVSTVKEAVAERASTMKRLDSDLRLQQKLLEAKVTSGASSPSSFTGGGQPGEIDL